VAGIYGQPPSVGVTTVAATELLTSATGRDAMPKIKHIALSTQDVDKTAKFYIDVFGMKEIARIDSPGARGYYLSDGDINLAILNFKNDAVAGVERGKDWSGLHHIGFQVESLEAIAERLDAAGSKRRDDVNQALGVGQGHRYANVEVKYGGPDGVMLDVSESGWVGTSGFAAS
jgi:glyoxylase I family protein